jgi:cytochrome c-type biogenesis protein CcmH/NrfG
MAARSKQDPRKKTAPAQKSAPQIDNVQGNAQSPEARERESTPPKKTTPARGRQKAAERHDGTVRKSTLYLTAILCLLLGTYLGTLLPAFRGAKEFSSPLQQSQPQQAPPPAGRADAGGQLKELEEAVRKNPQDMHAWIQLGNQHFDDGKPHEAIRAYERALSIRGDNPDVLTDMGIMYRQLGEFERAAEKFTQASKINPLHEQSRFNLGVVLFFDLNRKDEARKVWRALVGINPEVKTPDGALLRIMLDELK